MPTLFNKNRIRTKIIGTGAGLPKKVLTNFDLEKIVDTSNEWIVQRSGIKERRIAGEGESTVSLSLIASNAALEEAGDFTEELDMIIVGTQTPDYVLPSAACLLQSELKAVKASAFDVTAGCTGWLYGLVIADNFIKSNPHMKILVVGAEILSRRTNWDDRSSCVLFGDGAGATILTGTSDEDSGILSTCLMSDGSQWESLTILGGGCLHPPSHDMIDKGLQYIYMAGNKVYKLAVPAMEEAGWIVLADAGFNPKEVDHLIPHQANLRIMEAVAHRLGIPREKVVVKLDKYGNNSTATIPVAMAESAREGRFKKGDVILLVSFGGGFTWGGVLMKW